MLAVVLGFIVYWAVQASIDRQIGARIDAEVEILKGELRSEGSAELTREIETRINYFGALEYFLADVDGNRLAGNFSNLPTTDGWSDIAIADPPRGKIPSTSESRRSISTMATASSSGMILHRKRIFAGHFSAP